MAGEGFGEILKAVGGLGPFSDLAGIELVADHLLRVLDVNPSPTTSIVGIAKVMGEELANLILKAEFSSLPVRVAVKEECGFKKE